MVTIYFIALAGILLSFRGGGIKAGSIAVLPFEIIGTDRRAGAIVISSLRSVLVKNNYAVLREDVMRKILAEKGYASEECGQKECGIRFGKALSVDAVVIGQVLFKGNEVFLSASLIEVKTGREKSSHHEVLEFSEDVMPYSKKGELLGYKLMKRSPPGPGKKGWTAIAGAAVGGAGWLLYQHFRPRYGDADLTARFPEGVP